MTRTAKPTQPLAHNVSESHARERTAEMIGCAAGNPDLANDPQTAAKILAAFLKSHETAICGALKSNSLALARKKVNGGSHDLTEFVRAFTAGRKYLGIVVAQKAKAATKVKAKKKL